MGGEDVSYSKVGGPSVRGKDPGICQETSRLVENHSHEPQFPRFQSDSGQERWGLVCLVSVPTRCHR